MHCLLLCMLCSLSGGKTSSGPTTTMYFYVEKYLFRSHLILRKEVQKGEHPLNTAYNLSIIIHEPKFRVTSRAVRDRYPFILSKQADKLRDEENAVFQKQAQSATTIKFTSVDQMLCLFSKLMQGLQPLATLVLDIWSITYIPCWEFFIVSWSHVRIFSDKQLSTNGVKIWYDFFH